MRSQVETCCASEAKVFWCCAREVDHVVRISSIVLPERRDCVGGADVLAVSGAAGAVGPAVVVGAAPVVLADVVAPKRPPAGVLDAAGAPLEAGGCDEAGPMLLNKFEAPPADAVVGAVVAPCEPAELAAAAPPPRLEKRFDVVVVPPVVPAAAEMFCCPLKVFEACPVGALEDVAP